MFQPAARVDGHCARAIIQRTSLYLLHTVFIPFFLGGISAVDTKSRRDFMVAFSLSVWLCPFFPVVMFSMWCQIAKPSPRTLASRKCLLLVRLSLRLCSPSLFMQPSCEPISSHLGFKDTSPSPTSALCHFSPAKFLVSSTVAPASRIHFHGGSSPHQPTNRGAS